jgi:isoquinoline 1-oxidoreductase alpha subunit
VTEPTRLRINGTDVEVDADPLTSLQAVVHDRVGLSSVRLGCGVGACGTCTVLLDGEPVRSCLVPVGLVGDRAVVTNEALTDDDPIRAAFVDEHAYQCGYCIPGFVLATRALLARTPSPTEAQVDAALLGNICRCGSYAAIRRAIAAAVGGTTPVSATEAARGDASASAGQPVAGEPDDPE